MYSICGESLLNTYSTGLYLTRLCEQIGEFAWFPIYNYNTYSNCKTLQFMLIFKDKDQMTRVKEIMKSIEFPLYNIKEQEE